MFLLKYSWNGKPVSIEIKDKLSALVAARALDPLKDSCVTNVCVVDADDPEGQYIVPSKQKLVAKCGYEF